MVKYKIRDDLNLVIFSLVGTASAKEVIENVQLLKTREKIHPGMDTVIDTREQINVLSRDEVLKIFFEMVGVEKSPFVAKTAIIAVSTEEFGTGSLYSVYKNKTKVEVVVFTEVNNAAKWLGVPIDETLF
jgi:hypothetical protein